MSSPKTATVVIACPYCSTRYQVASETIGQSGRKVQCAHCRKAWQAKAEPPPPIAPARKPLGADDRLFDEGAERTLDDAFAAEERATSDAQEDVADARPDPDTAPGHALPPGSPLDAALLRKRQRAFSRREASLRRDLPMARFRRIARLATLLGIVTVVGGGFAMRTDIVRQFPELAGLYAAIGLPVNVVGLEIRQAETVKTLRDGGEVLIVSASIHAVEDYPVPVPPVIVALLDASGASIYEWSVTPSQAELEPGSSLKIETQLTAPPSGADRVELTFAAGRSTGSTPAPQAPLSEGQH